MNVPLQAFHMLPACQTLDRPSLRFNTDVRQSTLGFCLQRSGRWQQSLQCPAIDAHALLGITTEAGHAPGLLLQRACQGMIMLHWGSVLAHIFADHQQGMPLCMIIADRYELSKRNNVISHQGLKVICLMTTL